MRILSGSGWRNGCQAVVESLLRARSSGGLAGLRSAFTELARLLRTAGDRKKCLQWLDTDADHRSARRPQVDLSNRQLSVVRSRTASLIDLQWWKRHSGRVASERTQQTRSRNTNIARTLARAHFNAASINEEVLWLNFRALWLCAKSD